MGISASKVHIKLDKTVDVFYQLRRIGMIWQRWFSVLMAVTIAWVTTVSPAYGVSDLTWEKIRGGSGTMSVSMIDVGQGNCVAIGCPNGKKILADCGSTKGDQALKDLAVHYINYLLDGSQFDYIVLSHGDKDHYNIIHRVVGSLTNPLITLPEGDTPRFYPPGYVPKSGELPEMTNYDPGFLNLLKNAKKNRNLRTIESTYFDKIGKPNPDLQCSAIQNESNGIYVLAGNLAEGFAKNNNSIVLFLKYANKAVKPFTIMLPGDAETGGNPDIVNTIEKRYAKANFLSTDVMMASHHGAEKGITADSSFLDKTKPQVVVFSAGKKNTFNHPRCSAVNEISDAYLLKCQNHPLTRSIKQPVSYSMSASKKRKGEEFKSAKITSYDSRFGTMDSGTVISLSDGNGKFSLYTCPFPRTDTSRSDWPDDFLEECTKMIDNKPTN
ncbi:MAG: hypothetical protein GDA56_14940 [Hormoscilla sp. GM7CHS1pb]|nr:hypothetical protein [Hormoscilla sp. GM7CHS1pb]